MNLEPRAYCRRVVTYRGKVERIVVQDHAFAYSGKIPGTGPVKCIYCGVDKLDENSIAIGRVIVVQKDRNILNSLMGDERIEALKRLFSDGHVHGHSVFVQDDGGFRRWEAADWAKTRWFECRDDQKWYNEIRRTRIMDPHESMEVTILIDENKELKTEIAKLREAIGKAVERLPAFPKVAEKYLSKILKEDEG